MRPRPSCVRRSATARNLQVWTGAHISRVLLERDASGAQRAVGIEAIPVEGGEPVRARVNPQGGEVILCTGAIGTPQILQLSGIGDAALLKPLGVEVQHALPGVGANLQDHLQDPCRVRRHRCEDAEHDDADAVRQGADRP